ncbi:MAG: twin-arginine translocase subunit TatC [Proteobacteria bacterium]|nr:twin-arginine translocase subunit TatC [Pseudomonadota bacterium]MBU1714870.1 twin-arginine translocase subunit TatC [Pseudomonadota bacterium]
MSQDNKPRLISFINELRKSILFLGGAIVIVTIVFYTLSPQILDFFQKHLDQQLAFFTVAEPFLAHAKLALFSALFVLMPGLAYCLWKALAKAFSLSTGQFVWFVLFTCLLFYSGAFFCYAITLPFGVKFLLDFQSAQLKPIISIDKFVSFVAIFILAFGTIFELPIFMIFSSRVGLIPRKSFEKNRRYAVLAISIIAALLTPTPDVVNMLLMGVPLYLLYEMGILVLKMMKV